ncbi:predicted protein, partial [Nematostella vectensis]
AGQIMYCQSSDDPSATYLTTVVPNEHPEAIPSPPSTDNGHRITNNMVCARPVEADQNHSPRQIIQKTPFMLKFYFILQISHWVHCLPELYFMKAKKDEIFPKVQLYIEYLLFIWAAYML